MVGRITSQGDRAMRSNLAREILGLDGRGITIGVISDSFNAFQQANEDVGRGELPGAGNPGGLRQSVRVLKDDRNGSDEGRAMLQIIHDVAPGAKLLFHTSGGTEAKFATAIDALTLAGADIIVDDVGYFNAPFFQDGIGAQAVARAEQQGVLYFSAAGNDGNSSYQSPFQTGETFLFRGNTYAIHDFDPGEGVDLFQDIQLPAFGEIAFVLNWDQPLGQVNTEVEVFLLENPQFPGQGGKILQRGNLLLPIGINDAARDIAYFSDSKQTVYLLIASNTNAIGSLPSQIKWISVANGADVGVKYQYVNDTPEAIGGSTVYGHPNAAGAIAVGAALFRKTPAFSGEAPVLETFSSSGGSPILFDPLGNRLSMPDLRQKPEIVAPDGGATAVVGFERFFGTSAAAPHASAVAALMLQRAGGRKSMTREQVLFAMQSTAVAIDPPNKIVSTLGLIQADAAVISSYQTQILGTAGDDTMRGTSAADNLSGADGNDDISGDAGYDVIFGGKGQDRLSGEADNDYLLGGADRDRLVGGEGGDTLIGGAGGDRLLGGKGTNRLIGGKDRDLFAIDRNGIALIQDFQDGQDKLELPNITFRQLEIEQQGQTTVLMFRNDILAKLSGIKPNELTAADFRSANSTV